MEGCKDPFNRRTYPWGKEDDMLLTHFRKLGQLKKLLQIYDRQLTVTEEKYARQWLEMGIEMDAIAIAYDRTCVNTGNMNWNYMNKILARWHEDGIRTAQQVKDRDQKPNVPKGASGRLGAAELENIQRLLKED